jgi:hypothetical protein
MMGMPAAVFTRTFFYMLGGLIFWGGRFLAVYSFTAVACSRGWSDDSVVGIGVVPLGVGFFTLIAIVGCGALLAWAYARVRATFPDPDAEENTRFVHYIAATVAALSLLAVVWETLPVFILPVCT